MYLKKVPFNLALSVLGCFDSRRAARLFGLKTHKTIDRAREGKAVSGEFMGSCMAAFRLNAELIAAADLEVAIDTFFEEGTREREQTATAAAGLVAA